VADNIDSTRRVLRRLVSQERARANAAAAAADLRELRRQREEADAFVAGRARARTMSEPLGQASSSGSTR
jgi:hypothetical protein